MCIAIALAIGELPVELVDAHGLSARVHDRGGEREVRFTGGRPRRCCRPGGAAGSGW